MIIYNTWKYLLANKNTVFSLVILSLTGDPVFSKKSYLNKELIKDWIPSQAEDDKEVVAKFYSTVFNYWVYVCLFQFNKNLTKVLIMIWSFSWKEL